MFIVGEVWNMYTWWTKHTVFNLETGSTCGNYCVLLYSVARQIFSDKLFVMFVWYLHWRKANNKFLYSNTNSTLFLPEPFNKACICLPIALQVSVLWTIIEHHAVGHHPVGISSSVHVYMCVCVCVCVCAYASVSVSPYSVFEFMYLFSCETS